MSSTKQTTLEQYHSTIEELKTDVKDHDKTKREKINLAADLLAKEGYKEEQISSTLCEDLNGFITSRYVRQCLEQKYKNKNMARIQPEKIAVAAGSNEQVTETNMSELNNKTVTRVDPKAAREEYEKNKYYRGLPKGSQIKGASSVEAANAEMEGVQSSNKEQTEYIASLKQENDRINHELKNIKSEISQHTTVILTKDNFQKVYDFISDKKVKRVLFDYDRENMNITNIRADL